MVLEIVVLLTLSPLPGVCLCFGGVKPSALILLNFRVSKVFVGGIHIMDPYFDSLHI